LHPHFADSLPNIVELEWLDDRRNELHRMTFLAQSLGVVLPPVCPDRVRKQAPVVPRAKN
jgi:hypothetical protein